MWMYRGQPVEHFDSNVVGFVYLITNTTNNRKYVGRKLVWVTKTSYRVVKLKNGEKRRKKIKSIVPSDWPDYFGSSPELIADIEVTGKEHFSREILHLCFSKATMNYLEAYEQFSRKVLESDEYYNNNIMCKVHGSHIKFKLERA